MFGEAYSINSCRVSHHAGSCIEHSINLGAKHFISKVKPTPSSKLPTNPSSEYAHDDDDPDAFDGDDGEFDTGDAVGKALALVKQVCAYLLSLLLRTSTYLCFRSGHPLRPALTSRKHAPK